MKISLLISSLLLSAFFSGSETAFVSVNIIEAQIWLKRKLSQARWIYYFISHPDRYLITVLIGNNIAIILFTSLSTYYLQSYLNHFLILIFNSILLLLIGEILPKTLFREVAHKIIRFLAIPLLFFRWLFYPFYLLLNFIINIIMRILGQNDQNLSSFFTKQDLEVLLREGEQGGSIDPEERKIIARVLRLSNRHVREVMIPRIEMITLPPNVSINKAKEIFQQSGFSKLPIIGENLDDIQGIIYAKDLFNQPQNINDISRDVMFVPQSILCSDLIKKMKAKHITLAIALDEYGGTAGLVTVEDVIEELFGEISDEFDDTMIRMKKLSENEILANGKAEILFVNEKMRWKLPQGNYETVGGLILEHIGKIPEMDEIIEIDGFTITILRVDDQRIRFVKIRKKLILAKTVEK